MPFDVQLSAGLVKDVGLPIAYLVFNVSLFVGLLRQANSRAEKAEQRNEALTAQLLQLATAQTEASLKSAAALNRVTRPEQPS